MNELNQTDHKPLSVGDWIVTLIITAIPLVGFVMLFVWAFGSNTNPNKANWAKAALVLFAIGIVLSILFSIIFGVGIMSFLNSQENMTY
ncbi:hypothetical protein GCM10027429_30190 [Marivirga atlantica]|jgi:uncharacterized membrane protein YdbT with pleckstrin-like domain|uniref:Uncharacterized protein n=1 Tax=Marivirga atlantica TaxID=1548457 RepID=A0A937AJD8_9BACT|nr:hypothetical protein [Marivirga atlantica]MBL0766599.1 hypothetical protein [Marivirga atlantica]